MTTFTSKSSSLSIVVKPGRYAYNPDGSRYFIAGKRADFMQGMFRTDDEEVIEFLKNHRDYGVLFVGEDLAVPRAEMEAKVEASRKRERQLAAKTDAKATNKKLPSEGGAVSKIDPESDEGVASQFQNEDLIP